MDASWSSITNGTDVFYEMGDKKQTVQVSSGPLYTLNTHLLSFKQGSDGMKL